MSSGRPTRQPPSLLRPRREPLFGYVGLSVVGHVALVVLGVVVTLSGRGCSPPPPLIDPDQALEVSLVVLPRSESSMPDRAQRAPAPPAAEQPKPQPEAPTEPPPRSSDLVVHTEEPEPKPQPDGPDDDERRRELMAQLERERLLSELAHAPTGPVDRDASDPDSTTDESINALGPGGRGDPELARYESQIQQLFMRHFHPLAAITQSQPDLVTKVMVRVDPSNGLIKSWEIVESSGVPAYDAAADRAVQAVKQIPLPPAAYMGLVQQGYIVNFRAP